MSRAARYLVRSLQQPFCDICSGGGGSNVCLAVEEVRVVVFKVR